MFSATFAFCISRIQLPATNFIASKYLQNQFANFFSFFTSTSGIVVSHAHSHNVD